MKTARSTTHGLRVNLRGRLASGLTVNASYTFSKAIDDAEEIFPHIRNQHMFDFRSDRSLAIYDQRRRFVFSSLYETGSPWRRGSVENRILGDWSIAPIVEIGGGRPVNVLLGFDNNRDGYPGSDWPDLVPAGAQDAAVTRWGAFAVPPFGVSGNLGCNAFVGPGFASVSLRLQRNVSIAEPLRAEFTVEGFNIFNRTNLRTVNPSYQRAGPLSEPSREERFFQPSGRDLIRRFAVRAFLFSR